MRACPGERAELEDQRGGQMLDQRRMRAPEGVPAGIPGLDQPRDVLARQLLHLVVHAACESRGGDLRERIVQHILADTGKASGRGLESGELECACTGLDQAGDRRGPMRLGNRRIERRIDVAIPLDFLDLVAQELAVPHRFRIVVGHIDHGGHTACRRSARGVAEALLIGLAARMHLTVDDAGHHP